MFVHEDVKFHSKNWGGFIETKLEEPTCGVIGFAGSRVKLKYYSGWDQYHEWMHAYLYQDLNSLIKFDVRNVYLERPFEEVVVLDGLAMFVRKDIWERNPFDEEVLTGFHGYDIDFSLQISKYYKNYVCCSNHVLIEHFSEGNYNAEWFSETIRLHKCKWNNLLPAKIEDLKIGKKELKIIEEQLSVEFLKRVLDSGYLHKRAILKEFWLRPFSWIHLLNCLICTLQYIRNSQS